MASTAHYDELVDTSIPHYPAPAAQYEQPAPAAMPEQPALVAKPEQPAPVAKPEQLAPAIEAEQPAPAAAEPERQAPAPIPQQEAPVAAPQQEAPAAIPEEPFSAPAPKQQVSTAIPRKPVPAPAPEQAVSTALPETPALKRNITAETIVNESPSASPGDSPKQSPSHSSLSSLDAEASHKASEEAKKSKFIDGYGNDFEVPDYTIKDIRNAIPKHCFERSALRGLGYVARDMLCIATVFTIYYNFVTPEIIPNAFVRGLLWAFYSIIQGLFGTGLWVLAHECGHQSFSPSKALNDTVGFILHSSLLVPYFSWKISHGKHHKATGNMQRDMVFVPKTREHFSSMAGYYMHELSELTEEAPIATLLHVVAQQLFGWPVYLITNATGHNFHEKQPEGRGKGKKNGFLKGVNHFNVESPLYEAKDAKWILLSDVGIGITFFVLYLLTLKFGLGNMILWYFLPYIWVNHWLVAITFLQHTDPSLPHYNAAAWDFTKGAAATIDRDLGFVGRHLLHGIAETHVLHHYVSVIPFYHADEASEAIKPVMGRHYRADTKDGPLGFIRAMYVNSRRCQWVEPNEGTEGKASDVLFFRNRNGIGPKPAVLKA